MDIVYAIQYIKQIEWWCCERLRFLFYPSGSASRRARQAAPKTEERHAASVCFYYPFRAGYVSDAGVFGVSNVFAHLLVTQ